MWGLRVRLATLKIWLRSANFVIAAIHTSRTVRFSRPLNRGFARSVAYRAICVCARNFTTQRANKRLTGASRKVSLACHPTWQSAKQRHESDFFARPNVRAHTAHPARRAHTPHTPRTSPPHALDPPHAHRALGPPHAHRAYAANQRAKAPVI